MAIGNIPFTGLKSPFRASSPMNAVFSSFDWSSIPEEDRIPTAIGRSYSVPTFSMSAGARFTVIFFTGNFIPMFSIADFTLSLLSLTAVSGNPTVINCGSPWVMFTSTSTM